MLVITLKKGESVYLGDDIKVMYVGEGQTKGSIKFGFEAPKEVPIVRDNARRKTPLGKYV